MSILPSWNILCIHLHGNLRVTQGRLEILRHAHVLMGASVVRDLCSSYIETGTAAHVKQHAQPDSMHVLRKQAVSYRHLNAADLHASWRTTTSCMHELPEGMTMHSEMASAYRNVHCELHFRKRSCACDVSSDHTRCTNPASTISTACLSCTLDTRRTC